MKSKNIYVFSNGLVAIKEESNTRLGRRFKKFKIDGDEIIELERKDDNERK